MLPEKFYLQNDVVKTAKQLIGKVLVTKINGIRTSGIITETEAYAGETDRASHAFGGRRTKRTETMYLRGGVAYVYLCYGLHSLFNVVTNKAETPHAVLIRAIEPLEGIDEMNRRLAAARMKAGGVGPAKVSAALGITLQLDKAALNSETICIEDHEIKISPRKIIAGPRIGVDYAGEDAKLPYRFFIQAQYTSHLFDRFYPAVHTSPPLCKTAGLKVRAGRVQDNTILLMNDKNREL